MQNLETSNDMAFQSKMKISFGQKILSFFCHGPTFLFFMVLFQSEASKTPVTGRHAGV